MQLDITLHVDVQTALESDKAADLDNYARRSSTASRDLKGS